MQRTFGSFIHETIKQGIPTTVTSALAYCAWNIVDNFGKDKMFNLYEWVKDISVCGKSFNWKEMMTHSVIWGTASGVVSGGVKAYKEIKIVKWTYSTFKPPKTTVFKKDI
eukprot:UN00794